MHFIRDRAGIKSGQRVLINGASGGIGQYAVQLAKSFGAEVTGVCSTAKLELVKSLGADRVIDYTQEDFTQNGQTYDVILDTARVTSFLRCKGSLKEGGRYLLAVFGMKELLQMLGTSIAGGKKVVCSLAPIKKEGLIDLTELIEAGTLRPVIDKRYPMDQIAEAHSYVEGGHKKGYVVITQEQSNNVQQRFDLLSNPALVMCAALGREGGGHHADWTNDRLRLSASLHLACGSVHGPRSGGRGYGCGQRHLPC